MEFYNNETLEPNFPNYVVFIMITSPNRILLQRKDGGHPSWPNQWCLFGGKIEGKENNTKALKRELAEEIGKNVNFLNDPKFFIRQTFTEKPIRPERKVNVNYYTIPFDGDLSKIVFGEGAGFSTFSRDTLTQYNNLGLIVPPNYETIEKFYRSLSNRSFNF